MNGPEQVANYRCPCCGYKTLREKGGFEMCEVCWWEDDGQDDSDADTVRGGPNGTYSLTEGRANFRRCGTYDPQFIGKTRAPRSEEF